nr:hypothetical protein B0A51_08311 [Rachicladosporium sp. CCFEE 5018]OQO27123.1 hypothetical protein B0A51_06032 [Rachicladosporium sp. CCFEE 5018]OQO29436.1 hypothetical protein B0A51_04012 [Rachicladosporium sp. CCFEE 5018]
MPKIALVIGATSGIGRGVAIALASKGYTTIVSGRDATKGNEVVKEIQELGAIAAFLPVDLKKRQSIKDLHANIISTYGQLDVAVNCAGVAIHLKKTADMSEADIDSTFAVQITGFYLSMQAQLKAMLPNRSGHIINFSSIYGSNGFPFGSAISASKHAVIGMTKSAAIEYAAEGVYINAIAPGLVPTEMVAALGTEMSAPDADPRVKAMDMAKFYPSGRFGQPEDIGKAVLYLAEQDWVTGTVLTVDGGATAGHNL